MAPARTGRLQNMLDKLAAIVGEAHVLTGADVSRYDHDFT